MNDILKAAADRAGVTHEMAEALIKELRDPTAGMTENGSNVGIPPFVWEERDAELYRRICPGWEGLTSGEYDNTRAAVIWRAMCDGLLTEKETYGWEHEKWPHPKNPEEKEADES